MRKASPTKNQFAKALRRTRNFTGHTQEEFSVLSSRTYISSLERGLKSPTLSKVDELAHVMGVHPLTLLCLAYGSDVNLAVNEELLISVKEEIARIFAAQHTL